MTPDELAEIRDELALSPVQMARAMGVSYDTYKSWASGRYPMNAAAIRCAALLPYIPRKMLDSLATGILVEKP